jgi:hypothetical protein
MVSSRYGSLAFVCILLSLMGCGDDNESVRAGVDAAVDVRTDVSTDVPMFDVDDAPDTEPAADVADDDDANDIGEVDDTDGSDSTSPDADITDANDTDAPGDIASETDIQEDAGADATTPRVVPVISELMLSPCESAPGSGQWFELHNPDDVELNINGLTIEDGAGGAFLVVDAPPIAPGDWYVVAASNDPSLNGGIEPDLVFSGLDFSPDAGGITLLDGDEQLSSISWTAGTLPDAECAAASLDPSAIGSPDELSFSRWCPATVAYGGGDSGTPGEPNPSCVVPDTEVDWCRFQFPSDVSLTPGQTITAYVRVFEAGLTNRTSGIDTSPALRVEFGFGPSGTQPSLESWQWTTATGNPSWIDTAEPGNDEYQATVVAPETAGLRDMAFRASRNDGLVWLYCDRNLGPGADGAENGYQVANAARLNVVTPCEPNPCSAPPSASCDGTLLSTYEPTGVCSINGIVADCQYEPLVRDCALDALTCVDAACADPCDPNPCSAPPAASCDGNELVTFQATGTCALTAEAEVECSYIQNERVDCAAIEQECFAAGGSAGCRPPLPPVDVAIDWCRLQFPVDFQAIPGAEVTVFGRYYSAGVTDLTPAVDPASRLVASVGYGPDGSDPAADTTWVWSEALPNTGWNGSTFGEPNNDEYVATFNAPFEETNWDVAFRFSGDAGATWTYCDRDRGPGQDGAENGYSPSDAAQMLVTLGTDGCLTVDDCLAREFTPFCTGALASTNIDSAICNEENLCEYLYDEVDCALSDASCSSGDCVQREYTVGYCKLQFPETLTVAPDTLSTVYGIVYADGLTTRSNAVDTSPALIGQVGYGPSGSDPEDIAWTWSLAVPNPGWNAATAGQPNNDEYQAGLRSPVAPGTFSYAYRFSGDGGDTWVYCDRGAGSSNGFQTTDMGVLTVAP